MNKTFKVAALLGLSAAVSSATIISNLDNFNTTTQLVRNPVSPCGGVNTSTAATADAAGGYRTISVGGNTGCADADTNFTIAGAYAAALPSGSVGTFTIVWNANGVNAIDADFVSGFSFSARQDADAPPNEASSVVFRVCSNADGTGTCSNTTPAVLINTTGFKTYTAFLPGSTSDINYIQMTLTGGSERDVVIDFVNVDIPEPGTFVMAAGALLALGFFKRRQA